MCNTRVKSFMNDYSLAHLDNEVNEFLSNALHINVLDIKSSCAITNNTKLYMITVSYNIIFSEDTIVK